MKTGFKILFWQFKSPTFMKQISYLLIFASCLFFSGCQKEISSENPSYEINEKAILGKWMFVSLINSDNSTITNDSPCFADNYLEFREGRTGTISQGTCVESPSLPKDEDFNWAFKSAGLLDLGGDEVKILELTDSTLHFKKTPSSSGVSDYNYRWKK